MNTEQRYRITQDRAKKKQSEILLTRLLSGTRFSTQIDACTWMSMDPLELFRAPMNLENSLNLSPLTNPPCYPEDPGRINLLI